MKWQAFIAKRVVDTIEYDTEMHEFDLPGTTEADKNYACLEASKLFDAPEEYIICLPKINRNVDRVNLGERLCQWHSSMHDPIYAVGSFYVDDKKYPNHEIVDEALTSLRKDRDEFVRMQKGEKVAKYNSHYGRWIEDRRAFAGYTDEELSNNIEELNQIILDLSVMFNNDYPDEISLQKEYHEANKIV